MAYLNRSDVRKLWDLEAAEESGATASIAAVEKQSSESIAPQRNIIMVVPFNDAAVTVGELIGREPDCGLYGGAALATARVLAQCSALATADQSNAFTYVEAPRAWWQNQAGARVRWCSLPIAWTVGRSRPLAWLRPMCKRLAIGSTHAGFIIMAINQASTCRVFSSWRLGHKLALLNDTAQLYCGIVIAGNEIAVHIHVDDFGALSTEQKDIDAMIQALAEELERIGFRVKTTVGGCRRSTSASSFRRHRRCGCRARRSAR